MSDFDAAYGETPAFFGPHPDPLLVRLEPRLDWSAEVLDVGAGQGRNALYLARRGVGVCALDPAAEAMRVLAARAEGLPLRTCSTSIEAHEAPLDGYGAVLAFGLIPLLTPDQVDDLRERLLAWVRPGGLALLTAFTTDDPGYARHAADWTAEAPDSFRSPSGELRTYLRPGALRALLAGWEVLEHTEGAGPLHRHGDGPEHFHVVAALAARRPSTSDR